MKNCRAHTVESGEKAQCDTCISLDSNSEIDALVKSITREQKQNPRYDYASNEQLEIDRLVYAAYSLNADDIREVENWYARRYPALAAAQRANLERKLVAESKGGQP